MARAETMLALAWILLSGVDASINRTEFCGPTWASSQAVQHQLHVTLYSVEILVAYAVVSVIVFYLAAPDRFQLHAEM